MDAVMRGEREGETRDLKRGVTVLVILHEVVHHTRILVF